MTKPLFLLGEARGVNEAKINSSFVGPSGAELLRQLVEAELLQFTSEDKVYLSKWYDTNHPDNLEMIWNMHPEFYRSNVFALHPEGNKLETLCGPKAEAIPGYGPLVKGKGYISNTYRGELERLTDELVDVDPNLVLCLGNSALWALTGKAGISKVRGTTLSSTMLATGFKLLPTYHPAYVLRQYELRATVIADLIKAKREKDFPQVIRPSRKIWIEPTLEDLDAFYLAHIANCSLLSVDIETSGTSITCIGFAPSPDVGLVIPFFDKRRKDKSYWPDQDSESRAWKFVRGILVNPSIPKLFQNGLYDIAFLLRAVGIAVYGAAEDTMLLHHSLQPESLKGLGFLGSLYCDEGAWKDMRKVETIKRDE